ncbi:MAG: hypothetical protein P8I55_05180 [Crocinitomix sp.]|nr:hypothetical protein [Crocinitomix sp.]
MKRNLKHSTRFVGLLLKGAMLAYFACFFLGKNITTKIMSLNEADYELYEELETVDPEENKDVEEEKEKVDNFKEYMFVEGLNTPISLNAVETWNNSLTYVVFQLEIPDPPPQL